MIPQPARLLSFGATFTVLLWATSTFWTSPLVMDLLSTLQAPECRT